MGAHILDEAEAIKASIDQVLPQELRDRLLASQLTLTLGSSVAGPFHVVGGGPAKGRSGEVVVIDADELADRELVGHMVSLRKKRTGIDNTLFASTKGYGRHAARIKIAIDPPDSLNETCEGTSMALHDFSTVGAYAPPRLVEQVKEFIELNQAALFEYWEARIDTDEFLQRLRPVPPKKPP